MKYFIMWLLTVVVSYFMEIMSELRIFKDAADAGYKVDLQRLKDISAQINPDGDKIFTLSLLIPIFNMINVLCRTRKFDEDRGFLLDELRVIDALDEMSKVEQEEYSKKPTLFNALFIPFIVKKRLLDSELVVVMIENKPGEIYYEVGDEPNDITILASYGSASKLTADEQRKAIKQRRAIIEKSKDKNGVKDKLEENVRKNNAKALKDDINQCLNNQQNKKTKTISNNLTVSEQKQVLEELKELLKEKEQQDTNQDVKVKTLLKKRK